MSSTEDSFHLGVKALIRNGEGKVLLLERENRAKQTYWDLPGGRMHRGESELETLRREVAEEVGFHGLGTAIGRHLHLTNIRIPCGDSDVGLIISVYTFDTRYAFTPQLSDEHSDFRWFEVADAIRLLQTTYPRELIDTFGTLAAVP